MLWHLDEVHLLCLLWSSTGEENNEARKHQETTPLFPMVLSICHLFEKTIKEDRRNWESNQRLIGARKMSTNFTDHPQGICGPWWKRCWNICVVYWLPIHNGLLKWVMMTSCQHSVSPQNICMCTKDECVWVWLSILVCVYVCYVHAPCQSQNCCWSSKFPWDRQVLAPDYWHLCGHDISILFTVTHGGLTKRKIAEKYKMWVVQENV